MMAAMEKIERRVLGAIRFVDQPTKSAITRPMTIHTGGIGIFRNRSNLYIISSAPGLDHHIRSFDTPPPEPDIESLSFEIKVTDPEDQYLPQAFTLNLPRNPGTDSGDLPDSLFRPRDVAMYYTPSALPGTNWSIIRVSLSYTNIENPAPGALFIVTRSSDGKELGRGLSDKRGEALIAIPGIPMTTFSDSEPDDEESDDPVMAFEIMADMEIIFNPGIITEAGISWPVDPESMEADRTGMIAAAEENIILKAGETNTLSITLE